MTEYTFLVLILGGWLASIEIRLWITGKSVTVIKDMLQMLTDMIARRSNK